MIKFMFKCMMLLLVLFFGVLLGMQEANEGLKDLKGYDNNKFEGAFDIQENDSGEIEAAVLGEKVTSHNIKEKQEKLEEMKAFNFFSSLGSKLADIVSTSFQKLFHFIINSIDRILSSLG